MKISSDDDAILLLTHVTKFTTRDLSGLIDRGISLSEFVNQPELFCQEDPSGRLTHFCQAISEVKETSLISEIRGKCDKQDVQLLSVLNPNYPHLLREIHEPPMLLYVKGELIQEDDLSVAMVGARHASSYGLRMAYRFSYDLAGSGLTIVSGLARGIDAEAHRGALDARGRTIAVLGSGIDVIYPKENKKLYDQIAEQGAVVSEFPLGSEPLAYHFPVRNRIIAGLSQGVVVIEAHQKSGSLITASLAVESGREVYALPGSVDSIGSRGTNQLIKDGAKMALSADDILEDLSPVLRGNLLEKSRAENESQSLEIKLNEDEQLVFDLLQENDLSFNELIEQSGFEISKLSAILFQLESLGATEKLSSGAYSMKSI